MKPHKEDARIKYAFCLSPIILLQAARKSSRKPFKRALKDFHENHNAAGFNNQ